jgi:hypothetical protein
MFKKAFQKLFYSVVIVKLSKSVLIRFLTNSSVSTSLTSAYFNIALYKKIVCFGLSVLIHVKPLQPIAISNFKSLPSRFRNVAFEDNNLKIE